MDFFIYSDLNFQTNHEVMSVPRLCHSLYHLPKLAEGKWMCTDVGRYFYATSPRPSCLMRCMFEGLYWSQICPGSNLWVCIFIYAHKGPSRGKKYNLSKD